MGLADKILVLVEGSGSSITRLSYSLFRKGNSTGVHLSRKLRFPENPKAPDPREKYDVLPDAENFVDEGSGGISAFDNINPALGFKNWWIFKKGTEVPNGLTVSRDSSQGRITHHTIRPAYRMSRQRFEALLDEFGTKAEKYEGFTEDSSKNTGT